ncbi:SH3 domain-containing protein [Oscillospiraceae bacterium LTW-04]|nr:SH3 domain-containing protein [Oscillospiraceae bacterium MB24-C1]
MKKYLKTLFLAAVLAASLSGFAVQSAAAGAGATAGVVSTVSSPLMVRTAASVESAIVATLPKDSTVTLLSKSGSWWYVEYSTGKFGYCHANYITQISSSRAGYVATSSGALNIRTGGSTDYSVEARLPKGTGLVVLSENNGWSRVLYNGTAIGYASSAYVSDYALTQENAPVTYKAITLPVPDYKQYDSRWASLKVGRSGKTLSAIGCVTTALADTESYRKGSSAVTPATMLNQLSYNASGDVYWPSHYQKYIGSNYLSVLYQQLSVGKPVILGAKTSTGRMHWVVVKGYTGGNTLSTSGFLINDPGSNYRTTLATLMKEYPYFYKLEYYY